MNITLLIWILVNDKNSLIWIVFIARQLPNMEYFMKPQFLYKNHTHTIAARAAIKFPFLRQLTAPIAA